MHHITLHFIVQEPFMLEFFKWQTRFIWRSGFIWRSRFIIGEREQYAASALKIPIGCSAEDVSTLAPAAIKINSMTISDWLDAIARLGALRTAWGFLRGTTPSATSRLKWSVFSLHLVFRSAKLECYPLYSVSVFPYRIINVQECCLFFFCQKWNACSVPPVNAF